MTWRSRVNARVLMMAAVFVVAFAARLIPVRRGGGLRGYGPYDDSVYFASATGWVHGRWPYRDFLLLQPPGIVVGLAPFALLGRWLGDSVGLAVGRLAWMALGGLTAAGLVMLLWSISRVGAVASGLFFAFFWPAVMVGIVTDLEGLQNFLLVATLLLLNPFSLRSAPPPARRTAALLAGVALGLAWSIKIWELAPAAVIAGWLAYARRPRDLRWFGFGLLGAVSAVCLPFFLVAPRQMWAMVVADQLGRPWHSGWAKRLVYITGTTHLLPTDRIGPGLVLVLATVVIVVAVALRRPATRMVALLYLAIVGVLVVSPPTYVHYGAFTAPPLALLVGITVGEVGGLLRRLRPAAMRRTARGLGVAGLVVVLVALAYTSTSSRALHPRPTGRLAAIAARQPGCVTYDQPSQALSLDLVSRNLDRGCPLVVDLGAKSHWAHLQSSPHGRPTHAQRIALRYLRSGSASLLYRYPPGHHGHGGINIVGNWTLLARSHRLRLVKPVTAGTGP